MRGTKQSKSIGSNRFERRLGELLVGVEYEAYALQYPVAGVLGGVQVCLKDQSDSHGITSL